jgi:hypothetical protein
MFRLRFAMFAAVAALVLGTATALAMQEGASGADPDAHGDAVASAARTTCPHGPNGVHGQCVSAIASANGQAHRDGQAARVAACKATERATLAGKPDKAAKTAAHKAFAQCVSAGAATGSAEGNDDVSDDGSEGS